MARRQGGTLSGFTPLSTPNAPTGLSVSAGIGSATVSFTAPTDTGDAAVTSYIVTAVNESTGASSGVTGSASPITISPGGGTFKIRAQAVNGFGPGRLSEFSTGNVVFSGQALYAWGSNGSGRLGDNTTVGKSSPVQVAGGTNWSQVEAGNDSTFSIKLDGSLWAWGSNGSGQFGDNTVIPRSSPVQIGALTNWSQVSVAYHVLAVRTDGTLWAWGAGASGRLGDGTVVSKSSPVQIGALTDWYQVSAGSESSASIKTDGTLWTWGNNGNGELGTGNVISRSSPVQVGALTNWAQVAQSGAHTVSVKTDGTLWAWGAGSFGRLGTGNVISRSSPVQVGALTNWAQTSAGSAVKTDGTLWGWGRNFAGEIGVGDRIARSSPVQVGALTNWSQVINGGSSQVHSVKTDGTLWSWGYNAFGQVGDNTTISRSSPVQLGALTNWTQVSAGRFHGVSALLVP